jgi:hypothetical protein
MDVCLLWVLCVVRQRSVRRADHSSRGVLPTVVRRCVWSRKPQEWGGYDPRWVAAPQQKKKLEIWNYSFLLKLDTQVRKTTVTRCLRFVEWCYISVTGIIGTICFSDAIHSESYIFCFESEEREYGLSVSNTAQLSIQSAFRWRLTS